MARMGAPDMIWRAEIEAMVNKTSLHQTHAKLSELATSFSANKLEFHFDQAGIEKQFKTVSELQKKLTAAGGTDKAIGKLDTEMLDWINKYDKLAEKQAAAAKVFHAGGLTDEQAKANKANLDQYAIDKAALERELDKIKHDIDKRAKDIEDFSKPKTVQGYVESGKTIGSGFMDILNNAKAGDFAGMGKAVAGGLAKGTNFFLDESKKKHLAAAAEGDTGAAAKVAMAETLTGAVAAMTGVAVAVGAVVAALVAADGQAKEFNKSLLEGAGAADFSFSGAADHGQQMLDTLDAARDASIGMVWEFRGEAKEYTAILSQLNQAGETYKRMTAGAKDAAERNRMLTDNIKNVVVWSKNLGMSTAEVAAQQGELMSEYGVGIQGVAARFSAVSEAAAQSGMNTKNFFTSVSQATSGMSMYNVRMEEAAGLLLTTSKILGGTSASEFVKDLARGYKELGTTDRIKQYLIQGPGQVAKDMASSLDTAVAGFATDYGNNPAIQQAFADALGTSVDNVNLSTSEGVQKAFADMTSDQHNTLIAALANSDDLSANASNKQVQSLLRLERAVNTGDMKDAVNAMGDLNQVSVMLDKWSNASVGGIHVLLENMSLEQRAAYQSVNQMSEKQFQENKDIQITGWARFTEEMKKTGGDTTFEAFLEWSRKDLETQQKLAKSMETPKTAEDYARINAANTQSVADILRMLINVTLEKIYHGMEGFMSVMPWVESSQKMNLEANQKNIDMLTRDLDEMTKSGASEDAIAYKQSQLGEAQAKQADIVASGDSIGALYGLGAQSTMAVMSGGMWGDTQYSEGLGMAGRMAGSALGLSGSADEDSSVLSKNDKAYQKKDNEAKAKIARASDTAVLAGMPDAFAKGQDLVDANKAATAALAAGGTPSPIGNDFTMRPGQVATVPVTGATATNGGGAGASTTINNYYQISGGDQAATLKTITQAINTSRNR